jgi:hypothetical protein
VATVLVAVLLAACTGADDAAEEDTEVQGLVLERDEDPEGAEPPAADSEDERPEPDEEPSTADDPDESPTRTPAADDEGRGQQTPSPPSSSPTSTSDGDRSAAQSPGSAPGGDSAPSGSRSPETTETAPPPSPPQEPAEPAPEPAPRPPAPADLADGFTEGGISWSVQEEEWVELSSRTLERDAPLVEAGLVPVADPDPTADEREARCAVALHAPEERGLRAAGELEVRLVVGDADGGDRVLHRHLLSLDVELAAGEVLDLAPPKRGRTLQRDEVSRVSCEVRYTGS